MKGAVLYFFAISVFLTAILLKLLKRKYAELNDITRLYSNLAGATGFDNIIKILSDEIAKKGITVIGFYRKNRVNYILESAGGCVPLLERSSAVKAFFTLTPGKLGSHYEVDKEMTKKLGADTVFIPIHMKKEEPCWKSNGCGNKDCAVHNKGDCFCWLHSGKAYRNAVMNTYNEKLMRCISCKSFLPIGIFAVKGAKISRVHTFINNHFSGTLKNSVLYERAVYSANIDTLTNLLNRRGMEENLLNLFRLAEKYKHPLSLCLFDIDHFKKFNDSYGHQAGDAILRELSGIVSGLVREVDIAARYGGEEFCIIFPHTEKSRAYEVAERIREEVGTHVFSNNRKITVSMGLASLPDDEINGIKDLINKADIALYKSKITRNAVTSYCADFQVH